MNLDRGTRRLTALVIMAVLGMAGCGGDDGNATSTGGSGDQSAQSDSGLGDAVRAATGDEEIEGGEDDGGVNIGAPSLDELDGLPQVGVGAGDESCVQPPDSPGPQDLGAVAQSTLCLLNAERAARGLKPLKMEAKLAKAAAVHARDMVSKKYFAHDSQDGTNFATRIKRAGYIKGARSWSLGENLAWGTGEMALPRQIVKSWMESPGHKANILHSKFKQIGFGIVLGAPSNADGAPALTYATTFGTKK